MQIIIDETAKDSRLDKFLAQYLEKSRSYIAKLFTEERVLVNSQIEKPSYLLKEQDRIEYTLLIPKELGLKPVNLNLNIVYEDEDVAVVYKPEGLTVHPSPGTEETTLVHGLLYQLNSLSDINGIVRPGIVHRIDKDTSGLLMIAKNNPAHESIQQQLKDHSVDRIYHLIVYGQIKEERGRINAPIGRDANDRIKMAVVADGKDAVTNFKVLERFKDFTYLECKLETGRTHQIRIHMQYIGHPLVGDRVYGPRNVHDNRGQFLHAKTIAFTHPKTHERLSFDSEVPTYFHDFMRTLKKGD